MEQGAKPPESVELYFDSATAITIESGFRWEYYLVVLATCGIYFIIQRVLGVESTHAICLPIITIFMIMAAGFSKSIGDDFLNGFYLPLLGFVPLSIVSYFNEAKYGCFCPFWCTCPPTPAFYHLPRLIALLATVIVAVYSVRSTISGKRKYGFGLFLGLLVSVMIFLYGTILGFWGS